MPELTRLPDRADQSVVDASADRAMRELRRRGGNASGTIKRDPDGGGWTAFGRRVTDEEMLAYLTVLAARWWSGEGTEHPPPMSAVLGRAGE